MLLNSPLCHKANDHRPQSVTGRQLPADKHAAFTQRDPTPQGVRAHFTRSPGCSPAACTLYEHVAVCLCVHQDRPYVHCVHMLFEKFICRCLFHYSSLRWAAMADLGWVTMISVCACVCMRTPSMTHSVLLDRWGERSHGGQQWIYTRKMAT